jgi:hypothetical protein
MIVVPKIWRNKLLTLASGSNWAIVWAEAHLGQFTGH